MSRIRKGREELLRKGRSIRKPQRAVRKFSWPHGSRVKENILFIIMNVKVNVVCAQKKAKSGNNCLVIRPALIG